MKAAKKPRGSYEAEECDKETPRSSAGDEGGQFQQQHGAPTIRSSLVKFSAWHVLLSFIGVLLLKARESRRGFEIVPTVVVRLHGQLPPLQTVLARTSSSERSVEFNRV